jgi:hypothetical protein
MGCGAPKRFAFEAPDRGICSTAESRGTFGHDVHHRLEIRRRARDDAQDITRGGLLLERLLRLVEQPHVLDSDHGLVGEGLHERIWVSVKGLTSRRPHPIVPMGTPFRVSGTPRSVR